ncbi:MAG: SIMPL domain-containing protein [Azonexus sp.]|jgi:predicted secreted protein|nr:SIMPL domain-containing protein [Azonexus sp.]
MKKTLLALLAGSFAAASQAGALIDLAAEAGRPAANDMVRASVYSEASGSNPADLARQVNGNIGEALKLIREKKGVTVKSGNQSTYPIYTQSRKIDGWRMRSELLIESRDFGAVSELLGRLQQMRLAVGDIAQMPSPETRRQVEDEAMREAIRAFQNRAAVVAEQLGKGWKIKQMHINQGGGSPVPIMRGARAAMLAADATPAPIEAGESTITTHVTGQIELED